MLMKLSIIKMDHLLWYQFHYVFWGLSLLYLPPFLNLLIAAIGNGFIPKPRKKNDKPKMKQKTTKKTND